MCLTLGKNRLSAVQRPSAKRLKCCLLNQDGVLQSNSMLPCGTAEVGQVVSARASCCSWLLQECAKKTR